MSLTYSIIFFIIISIANICGSVRAENLSLENGDRIAILGDSLTYHDGFPNYSDYVASYLLTYNPSLMLHVQAIGRSGLSVSGCLDSSPIGYQHYSKYIAALQPNFVLVMFADNGGYSKAMHKGYMQTLVDDYIKGVSSAEPVLIGMLPQADADGYYLGAQYDDAIAEIAQASTPTFSYYKLWQELSPVWKLNKIFTANTSTGLLTSYAHGFVDGTRVVFEGGMAPTPLLAQTYYFVRDSTANTFKLSASAGGTAITLTSNGTGINRISSNWPKLRAAASDEVHPGPVGSLIAAWKLITGLGWSTSISQASINASNASLISQNNCAISSLVVNAYSGIDFTRLDSRIPWGIDEVARVDAISIYPSMAGWQNYSLRVQELATGQYDVFCDGELLASVSSAELSNGWNMADLTVGPIWRQSQEVLGRIRDMQGINRTTFSSITSPSRIGVERYRSNANGAYTTTGLRGQDLIRALSPNLVELATADSRIHAAAHPVPHNFSIRLSVSALPPSAPGSLRVIF